MRPIIKQTSFSPPAHTHPSNSNLFFAKNIVIIIVVMFLICGVLHFLVRFIMNKIRLYSNSHHQSTRVQESGDGDAAIYQRQLHQLFNLHDSGLDQSSIDALPVFIYKELTGFRENHHCAVCLCEFTQDDILRLLPVCSHAFHTHCIDTWLLSNSTGPLCRGNLFTPGFSVINPVFDFDHVHSREDDDDHEVSNSSNTHDEVSGNINQFERVYPVRLGKFRAIGGEKEAKQEVGGTSDGNLNERRCYSMEYYEYGLPDSHLQVALCTDKGRAGNSDLRIEKDKVKGIDEGRNGKEISNGCKGECFSVSKIWLWSMKDDHKFQDSSTPIWSYPHSLMLVKIYDITCIFFLI